ncbi:PilZ domain-containing protein [Spirochaetota bacterium]
MALVTSQQLTRYYNTYKSISVTYTKEIVKAIGLQVQNVFLKCLGEQWPCVLYSSSFESAKILAPNRPVLLEKIAKANNLISIRLAFKLSENSEPVMFFISGRASGFSPYTQSDGTLHFINMQFTQRPPDDFVEILGRMLEANVNSKRRADERILITPDVMRRISLAQKETTILVEAVPRRCIVRDLSFTGAKVIIVGIAKFLIGKSVTLRLEMEDPRETLAISGKVVRYENVENRKDLAAIAINFDEDRVPMSYKMHINDYIGQKKGPDEAADTNKEGPAPSTGS